MEEERIGSKPVTSISFLSESAVVVKVSYFNILNILLCDRKMPYIPKGDGIFLFNDFLTN